MAVTVRQKRKGRGNPWHVFIHHNSNITSRKVGDKKAAESVAAQLRKEMAAGRLNLERQKNTCPEFAAYAEHYIETYAKPALKRNTWKSYETIINRHLTPLWQGKRLNEIKRADVKKLILQKQKDGLAAGTVENIKALVSGIFTHAYEEELLTANPALKLGRFIQKQDTKKDIKPFTKEQMRKFLAVAEQQAPDCYALMLCAFRTGMRLGELTGLAWEDIDFEANLVEVRRSYSHAHFSSPKSHKSRLIDMSNQLRQTLLAYQSSQVAKFGGTIPRVNLTGKFKPNSIRLVFPNKVGKPLCGDNFRRRVFKALLEKADLPATRIHNIRHTFASLLLQQGEPLNYVMEQMGHASIQTTVNTYGHIVPGSNRNAVNMLDDEIKTDLRLVTNAS